VSVSTDKELRFSVDSLLLSELGERLVSKNYVALAELIKNAYDADAPEVKVIFRNTTKPSLKGMISIVDNGNGMTFEQVKDFWMTIATPNKLRAPLSPRFGRKKTGDKGIGRFACRRLAKKLILESTAKTENHAKLEYTTVKFDWETFEPGKILTEVPNVYETKIVSEGKIGTTLSLTGLDDLWTQRDFNVLRRQILGLSVVKGTKRKGFEEDPGFEVTFDAPEFEMSAYRMADQVMNAGWGRLRGEVSSAGVANLKLEAMNIGHVNFELPDSFSKIPGVAYDIALIWRTKEHCRDSSIFTLGVIDEILEEYSGTRVYLDGFRVYPYGDPGDDWLDIDKDVARRLTKASDVFRRVSANLIGVEHSRAMLNHPANRNLVGHINISNTPNKIFDIKMSREGFVEDEAFGQLKKFVRQGLEWATIYYDHFLYKRELEKVKESEKKLEEAVEELKESPEKESLGKEKIVPVVTSALNVIEESIKVATSDEEVPDENKKELYSQTKVATRVLQESVSHMERQIDVLRTIASTGALMLTFVHEARTVVAMLDTHASTLERLADKLGKDEKQESMKLAAALRATRDRFDNQIKLFHGVSRDLTTTERRRVLLGKTLSEVIDCFGGLTKRFKINIEPDIPGSLRTGHILESEAYSILINLVSNAIKAVIAGYGHRIKVEAHKEKEGTVLNVYDDGIGLSKDSRTVVGMPLVADPEGRLYKHLKDRIDSEDLLIVGEGSGMGLSIVKDIAESYGKELKFIDVHPPWKTCVEVTLP
jgi:signal transduction histidine kinase